MNNHTKNIITLSLAFFSIALIAKENVDNLNTTTSSVVNSRVAEAAVLLLHKLILM